MTYQEREFKLCILANLWGGGDEYGSKVTITVPITVIMEDGQMCYLYEGEAQVRYEEELSGYGGCTFETLCTWSEEEK